MWTTEGIKELLGRNNAAVERGLIVLYERQTADEQATQHTSHHNGMGFSAFDAEILSSFAEQIQRKMDRGTKLGACLSEKQMAIARKKVSRYAKQLTEVANNKAPQPQVEVEVVDRPQEWVVAEPVEIQIEAEEAAMSEIEVARAKLKAWISR